MEALDVNAEILNQLAAINAKLDRIDAQVQQISRRQRALEDLIDEFGPLAKEVYQTLLEELCCVQDDFDLDDVADLARKLLRNTRRFSEMLDLLGSAHDFLADATPLGKDVFVTVVELLDQIERKGGFEFARQGVRMVEQVLEHFTPEDAALLADNIVNILEATRSMTQPDVMSMVNTSLQVVREEQPKPVGIWDLIKAINDPQIQHALGLSIAMLRQFPTALGAPQAKNDSSLGA
jgi:uncharacterized protein YjgD (DUF1641 family)